MQTKIPSRKYIKMLTTVFNGWWTYEWFFFPTLIIYDFSADVFFFKQKRVFLCPILKREMNVVWCPSRYTWLSTSY